MVGEVFSVLGALIFVCALCFTSFLSSMDVTAVRPYVGHPLLGHNNSNHTAELCSGLFPLNLKKSPNPLFSFRNQRLPFKFFKPICNRCSELRFYLLLMPRKISPENPFKLLHKQNSSGQTAYSFL